MISEMGGTFRMHIKPKNAYNIFSIKPKGKKPYGGRDGKILNLRERGCEYVNWTEQAHNRVQWQTFVE